MAFSGRLSRIPRLRSDDARPAGCCYDDNRFTPEDRIRYDAGLVVDDDFDARGEVSTRRIPAGLAARIACEGTPLELSGLSLRFVRDWLPTSGYHPRTLFGHDLYPASLLALAGNGAPSPAKSARFPVTLCLPVLESHVPPSNAWG